MILNYIIAILLIIIYLFFVCLGIFVFFVLMTGLNNIVWGNHTTIAEDFRETIEMLQL
jgi:hypothetical protein